MKKIILPVLILGFLLPLLVARQVVQAGVPAALNNVSWRVLPVAASKVDPLVQTASAALQPGDMLTVIVTLRQQANLSQVRGVNRAAQQEGAIRALQATANATQGRLISLINTRRDQGLVKSFTALWVFNGISVTATQAVIDELAKDPDVMSITSDDLSIIPAFAPAEPNIAVINAPALWNLGLTGQGVVVANMDSGVDVSHPDLTSRWRGGSNSWYDPYGQHPATPTDLSGHGTWTMGIMLGGDAGGTTLGVAPDARWIAAKIFNDQGGSTATAIHLGFQWLLDPDSNPSTPDAPQVVNNSWSYAYPGCYLDFEADLQSLRAVGILPVFAAGNGGPNNGTSYSPANNPSAFAVGGVNNNDRIYTYSSRGPSTCGGSTGVFPEMVAPGVNIRTTDLFGGYYTNSGTSFATPHVAGALALLISAFPNLSPADQENALMNSAVDLGPSGPDDIFGYGRLDVLGAYNFLAAGNNPTPTPTPLPTPTSTPIPSPTPTATPPAATMHIGDLDGSSTLTKGKWNAIVNIWVHDTYENPVANATVYGLWSNGATGKGSCITNSSGICQVTKTGLSTKITSVTFTITKVTLAGFTYTSSANHDPDGDSNGTGITVMRP